MSELVYREKCEHGDLERHFLFSEGQDICPGGIDTILDPDKELVLGHPPGPADGRWGVGLTVADVLAALDGATE